MTSSTSRQGQAPAPATVVMSDRLDPLFSFRLATPRAYGCHEAGARAAAAIAAELGRGWSSASVSQQAEVKRIADGAARNRASKRINTGELGVTRAERAFCKTVGAACEEVRAVC